jgi:hypothetical protein
MRLANVNSRATILTSEWAGVDVHASSGRFGPAMVGIHDDWGQFAAWAGAVPGAMEAGSRIAGIGEIRQAFVAARGA